VERVLPKYAQFLERFPTIEALADGGPGEAIRTWQGLGYNQRAVRLWGIARTVMGEHGGHLADSVAELRRLPGVGGYTAAAVACFAFGAQTAVVDTNVRRVLGRHLLGTDSPPPDKLASLAEEALPQGRAWEWNQAVMDLGALVCTSRAPRCGQCPLRTGCRAAATDTGLAEQRATYRTKPAPRPFKGSSRYYRGRLLAALALPRSGSVRADELARMVSLNEADTARVEALLPGMQRDGLVVLTAGAQGVEVSLPP
jgi:A/G-specific adenine glycosylase